MTDPERRPPELDGAWEELPPSDDYRVFRSGPVIVHGFDGPDGSEPHGELVTTEPVRVHIERMDDGLWWIGLSWGNDGHVAVRFWSTEPISVHWWGDERG
jgi:hypothetical protein